MCTFETYEQIKNIIKSDDDFKLNHISCEDLKTAYKKAQMLYNLADEKGMSKNPKWLKDFRDYMQEWVLYDA